MIAAASESGQTKSGQPVPQRVAVLGNLADNFRKAGKIASYKGKVPPLALLGALPTR